LWRMDSALAPLMANESARPYFFYAAFYPAGRAFDAMFGEPASGDALVASPLLTEKVEHVLLHFQVDASGAVSSPAVPQGAQRALALARQGVDEEELAVREQRLGELRSILENEDLSRRLLLEQTRQQQLAFKAPVPSNKERAKGSLEWAARSQQAQQAS